MVPVDTKKKELVGEFNHGDREWRPQVDPEPVRVYVFVDSLLEKANPYGVYDPTVNVGWVSVGVDHDTAEYAVETLRPASLAGKDGAFTLSRRPRIAEGGGWRREQCQRGQDIHHVYNSASE